MFNQVKILSLVIIILFAIILLERVGCHNGPVKDHKKPDTLSTKIVQLPPIIIHDTVPGKPVFIKSEPIIKWRDSIVYKPDTSYDGLLEQYDRLGDKYFSRNIYKTPFKLGNYGTAEVTDTIVANQIVGNGINYHITIPQQQKVITVQAPSKDQVFIGGGLTGSTVNIIHGIELGLIYKNKKDQLFEFKIHQPIVAPTEYGVSTYWKLHFR